MVRALSNGLRKRVVFAVEGEGVSRREASIRFGVSYPTVNKWVSRYKQTSSFAPLKIGGYRLSPLLSERDFICSSLEECSHMGLDSCVSVLRKNATSRFVWLRYGAGCDELV